MRIVLVTSPRGSNAIMIKYRNDNEDRTPSIAVIGSGPGGMSTAMLLARAART